MLTLRVAAALVALIPLHAQDDFGPLVERARHAFNVPGIAIAVVHDGRVSIARGYGTRRAGEAAPVTAGTLFRIASNTKAFTAAALAMLVDEGRVRWDDAVLDHLPDFRMYDAYVTREMTVRDLLVHRSGLGLGAGDLMFFPPTDLSGDEIVRRLRFLKPASSFRSRYAYDNLLYLVAGRVITAASGRSWEDFVAGRILEPLGMSGTVLNTKALRAAPDVAAPHSVAGGRLEIIPDEDVDNNAPAGAIASSAQDMAKWMLAQLNRGDAAGGRLFSQAQSREMWSAQTILPIEETPASQPAMRALEPNFSAYGLGWTLRDYRGVKLAGHTGGLAGYVSRVVLVPERKLGIVVLTNQESTGAHSAIAWTILDHYLGAAPTDWVAAFSAAEKLAREEAGAAVRKAAGARDAASKPSLPLARYAGRYSDAWYGDVLVEARGGALTIRFSHTPQLSGTLEHWQYDTFVVRWQTRTLDADAYLTFSLARDGSIDRATMSPVSPLTDFSFDFADLLLRPAPPGSPPR